MTRFNSSRIDRSETETRWGMLTLMATTCVALVFLSVPGEPLRRAYASADPGIDQLIFEIYQGDIGQVRRALERVADVNVPDNDGRSLLAYAAVAGRAESPAIVRMLLDRGANVHARDSLLETPLFDATRFANTEVAAMLLQAGSDPRAQSIFGGTPLHLAVDSLDAANLTRMLLDAGADPLAVNDHGESPVDYARECENSQVEAMLKEGIERHIAVR